MKTKKILLALITITLLFSQNAFAKRLGGGRSYGMQRRTSHNNYNSGRPNNATYNTGSTYAGQNTQQPQRSGMGAGTAAVLGAAAGAAGGYMLGRSSNEQHVTASGVQQQPQEYGQTASTASHIPWGLIAVLAIILGFGLMLFRKNKIIPSTQEYSDNQNFNNNIFQSNVSQQNMQQIQPNAQGVNPGQPQMANVMDKMPDGIETIYFLRQVKGMFLHVQSMNNSENVNEIEKYMTPQLYMELKNSVSDNSAIADFNNLDCQLLDCSMENNQLVASVKFTGMVSEDPSSPPVPFNEIWNFIKTDMYSNRWLIAGIQQENTYN